MYIEINNNNYPNFSQETIEHLNERHWGGRWNYREIVFNNIVFQLSKHGFDHTKFNTILDFGCGSGRIASLFDYSKQEIWGTDINENKLKWCRENMPLNINFIHVSTPHLPFSDGYFNCIYAISVFTHIGHDYLSWLLELRRILSDDGVCLITIIDDYTIYSDIEWNYIKERKERLKDYILQDYRILHAENITFFRTKAILSEIEKYFKILEYIKEFYFFQSGIVLTKK